VSSVSVGASVTEPRLALQLVEEQARLSPQAPALRFAGQAITYERLNAEAEQLARRLRYLRVGREKLVAICLDRSPQLIVALLATFKAAGAYMPLDPAYPAERLRLMSDDSDPAVLVTSRDLSAALPKIASQVLLLDGDEPPQRSELSCEMDQSGPDDLAYVIFTSGSTGRPRGVAMPHRPLANLLAWQCERFLHQGPRRVLQFASVGFDVAFQEIFSTLATGGCLVLLEDWQRRDFDELAALIVRERIERMLLPPIAIGELARRLNTGAGSTSAMEVISCGERLNITQPIRELFGNRPQWSLENQYGPSETHCVTAHRLGGDPSRWPDQPPIGVAIPNVRIALLDAHHNPVPAGQRGEIAIGGAAPSRGYLRQPVATAERFLADSGAPLHGAASQRWYLTGDLACALDDGSLEYLGRVDDQVKIRGFRVEPGEVVGALTCHPDVADAAVVAEPYGGGLQRLVAYIVSSAAAPPDTKELRAFLRRSLPDHLVPSAFVALDSLPQTANGKLNRDALPPAADVAPGRAQAAPIDVLEQRLAEIWSDVLGGEQVEPEDNFFELGGHSLLAADVVARACVAFDVALPVRAIFAGPTVRELSAEIEKIRTHGGGETPIPRAPRIPLDQLPAQRA
jgi:amino acid adenylation domain-containing protein